MPLAALFVVQGQRFHMFLRLFQVSMPLAALFVVQGLSSKHLALAWSFNAARGFVCGARGIFKLLSSRILLFQCRSRLCLWCKNQYVLYVTAKGKSFNAARGFVCGARQNTSAVAEAPAEFQCRSRLCLWCKWDIHMPKGVIPKFQCRSRLCLWCKDIYIIGHTPVQVSMPLAALFVVQASSVPYQYRFFRFQCRSRLCLWCK